MPEMRFQGHCVCLRKAEKTIHEERHDYTKEKRADEKWNGDVDERFTSQYSIYAGIHGTGLFVKEKFRYDLTVYVRHWPIE